MVRSIFDTTGIPYFDDTLQWHLHKKKNNKIRNTTFDLFKLEKQTKNFQQP